MPVGYKYVVGIRPLGMRILYAANISLPSSLSLSRAGVFFCLSQNWFFRFYPSRIPLGRSRGSRKCARIIYRYRSGSGPRVIIYISLAREIINVSSLVNPFALAPFPSRNKIIVPSRVSASRWRKGTQKSALMLITLTKRVVTRYVRSLESGICLVRETKEKTEIVRTANNRHSELEFLASRSRRLEKVNRANRRS